MAMPLSGTFDYVAKIPVDWENSGGSCEARLTYSIKTRGNKLRDGRLVGHTPRLQIEDAGPTPNPGWDRGVWLPNVLRSRIKLTAPHRRLASVATASFFVDTNVVAALQPGDLFHLSRSGSADLAISLIRGETLLMAAGDVTQVPLGKDFEARYPTKLTQALEGVFDPFEAADVLPEIPVEIALGGQRQFLCRGTVELGPFVIFAIHGFLSGMPGRDGCLAISRKGKFPPTAANATAQLLVGGAIEMVRW